jgi:hypothetical protein
MTATVHLRGRKGGPLCGDRGETVGTGAIEWFVRQRRRRCDRCLRIVVAHLEMIEPTLITGGGHRG